MKKHFVLGFIQLLLFLTGMIMLIVSLFIPWANTTGLAGLANRTIYPYKEQSFHLIVLLPPFVIGGIFASVIYSFFTSNRLLPGVIIFILGAGTSFLGIYLWKRIAMSDVCFLGIDPLKLADVHPGQGILFLIVGGSILALYGLIFLVKPVKKK